MEFGDRGLSYGPENLAEMYSTAHLWRGSTPGPICSSSSIPVTIRRAALFSWGRSASTSNYKPGG